MAFAFSPNTCLMTSGITRSSIMFQYFGGSCSFSGPDRWFRPAAQRAELAVSAGLGSAHAACDDFVFEQAALQRAVVERRALGHLQLDHLGQIHVGAENVAVPAGEFLFQRIAEFGVELGQFLLLAHALAVGDRKSV